MPYLCAPALIYLLFSLIQIMIDIFKGLFNTAFIKTFVMIIVTFLLNLLCEGGMTLVSWIIVFIPFIFMTVIISLLLFVFGLDAATGTFKQYPSNISIDKDNNIIIYDLYKNYLLHPAYYQNESIFIPNPNATIISTPQPSTISLPPPSGSSDPSYQS